jgi:hypothetical protein
MEEVTTARQGTVEGQLGEGAQAGGREGGSQERGLMGLLVAKGTRKIECELKEDTVVTTV